METISLHRLNHYSQFAGLVLAACAVYAAVAVVILIEQPAPNGWSKFIFISLLSSILGLIYLSLRNFIDVSNSYHHMEDEYREFLSDNQAAASGKATQNEIFSPGTWLEDHIKLINKRSNIMFFTNGIAVALILIYFLFRMYHPAALGGAEEKREQPGAEQICLEQDGALHCDAKALSEAVLRIYGECLNITSQYTNFPIAHRSECARLAIAVANVEES